MRFAPNEKISLRVKQLPGVNGSIELADVTTCSVVCGPNNSGKTRLLRGMITKDNFEWARELSQAALSGFREPFDKNSFYGKRFVRGQIPTNGLSAAQKVLSSRRYWYASDIDDFVRSATKQYVQSNGAIDAQDAATLFAGPFRSLLNDVFSPSVVYLTPKRKLTSPGALTEPALQVEVDSAAILGQLFWLKNSALDDKKHARFRDISVLFKKVTGARFDVTLEPGAGASIYLRIAAPGSKEYRDSRDTGLGYQDALTICYCLTEPEIDILVVEEAENHLHPDIQRKLLTEFLSGEHGKRVIVSTHSSVFLERPERTKIFVCRPDSDSPVFDTTNQAVALASIGVTNLAPLTSTHILLVEGSGDVAAYNVLLDRLGISQRERISVVPLGGDNMPHFPLHSFKELCNLKAVVDNDPKSHRVRDEFVTSCIELDIPVHKLERYAIENYFDSAAYKSVFPQSADAIPSDIQPDVRITDQLPVNPKAQLSRVAETADLEMIEASDLGQALRRLFPEEHRANLERNV